MYKLCRGFIQLGIKKIRITGGEPLVRKGIIDFFEMLKPHLSSDLEELTLTTNGTQLQKYATALYSNGVKRVNVSLDTLDQKKFKKNDIIVFNCSGRGDKDLDTFIEFFKL